MRYPSRKIMTRAWPAIGILLLLASCRKDGAIPAYINVVQPAVVDANGAGITSKITDLWVYVNDQPAGVWEPGKPIPLIAAGASSVKLIAGVRKNGITNERIQYPFYATWQQPLNLVPEQTLEIQPKFRYFDNLSYWIADFNTGQRFDTLDCTATMQLVPSDSTLEGQGGANGRVNLDPAHSLYRGVSSGDPFINVSSTAFLEMDYRSDTPLLIGVRYSLYGVAYLAPCVYVNPTRKPDGSMPWNKVYIDLGTPWAVASAMDKRFFLQASLNEGAATGVVEVDNIKVVQPGP